MNRDHEPTPIERWADAVRAHEDALDGPSEATKDAVLHYARSRAAAPATPAAPRRLVARIPGRVVRRATWAAAAVVAAIVVLPLVQDFTEPAGRDADENPRLARDFNDDGRVDVLDAQALARGLARGEIPAQADVDANGTVDRDDVDTLLREIVRLPGGAS